MFGKENFLSFNVNVKTDCDFGLCCMENNSFNRNREVQKPQVRPSFVYLSLGPDLPVQQDF